MDLQKLDDDLIGVMEKRIELADMSYSDDRYDDVEEELHDLEDEFMDKYGDYLEKALKKVHDEYCTDNDVLLPTAYIVKNPEMTDDGGFKIGKNDGVLVDLMGDSADARLVIVPSPTRILLLVSGRKPKEVWVAS
jgi:hypothetical protein